MSLALLNLQEHITDKSLTVCWRTGEQMSTSNLAFEPVMNDSEKMVVWWYCSNCDEWHVTAHKPKDSLWLMTAPNAPDLTTQKSSH